jgi:uncharacterized protein YvpB
MKKRSTYRKLIVIVMIIGLSYSVHAAEMYRWVDNEGGVHYSDEQPEGIREAQQLRVQDSEPKSEAPAKIPEAKESAVTTSQKIPVKDPRRVTARTQKKLDNFPLVFQKNNWCVLASMEMIFKYHGFDVDQDMIFKNMKGRRSTVREGEGLDPRTAARFLSRSGFNVDYREGGNLETVIKYIDNNVPVMWGHFAPGKWEGSRHMAVVIGYDDVYNLIIVADPGYGREISLSYDEFKNQWERARNVMIAVSK